jgi:uncharacterized protein YdaT
MTTEHDASRQRVEERNAVLNEIRQHYTSTGFLDNEAVSILYSKAEYIATKIANDVPALLTELDRLRADADASRQRVDELTAALKPFADEYEQFLVYDAKSHRYPKGNASFLIWLYEHADEDVTVAFFEAAYKLMTKETANDA